jgi:hypothetical protein
MTAPPPTPGRPQGTTLDRLPSWRTACLAYREVRRRGELDSPAFFAALDAFRALRPEVPEREARAETRRAICWAASEHTKWFWSGVHYCKPESRVTPRRSGQAPAQQASTPQP